MRLTNCHLISRFQQSQGEFVHNQKFYSKPLLYYRGLLLRFLIMMNDDLMTNIDLSSCPHIMVVCLKPFKQNETQAAWCFQTFNYVFIMSMLFRTVSTLSSSLGDRLVFLNETGCGFISEAQLSGREFSGNNEGNDHLPFVDLCMVD